MEIRRIGVIGAGTMGHGIAHASALGGFEVNLYDLSAEVLDGALVKVQRDMQKGVDRGKLEPEAMEAALSRITGTLDLAEAVDEVDLVVEAIPEKLALKRALFAEVQGLCPEHAVLATNTSSLSVAAIAEAVEDPGRVIGAHFFNPVHIMKLLELIVHPGTRDGVLAAMTAYGEAIGKQCITVKDFPGFATSRLGVCLGMEAIRMVEQGVASPEDIDTAMVLGYRHPVGPLKLTDMVGLDVRMHIGEYLARELGNPAFEPPALMREMVAKGNLGKKSGKGFYDWD
ncbi:MAG: 3-hydroxyacyl-CoA dehydrogenase family protein [Alphaproteobacteria bacterium]|nr:3-hydroxyacyl-CoA dehydrogenase family protein [Alphaproteobacteria bacterium]